MSTKVPSTPLVSVVIPCRNEAQFIGRCLESVVASDYPKDRLEVLVVDGASEDGTRNTVEAYARRHGFIRVLENPRRITPVALNIGIRAARGRFVFWMGAHSTYPPDYISESVRHLLASGADNVGGVMVTVPRETTLIGRAIVTCLSHPFGVGNSYFRIHTDEPRWVDTVFGGAYRREVFRDVGLFNERLVRGQDMEFNLRLRRARKKTLLVPTIKAYYYARANLAAFWRHNWTNGVWAVKPFLYSAVTPVTWRHLIPLVFVVSLLGSLAVGFLWRPAWLVLGGILAAYLVASAWAAVRVARAGRDWPVAAILPAVFASLHIAYGLGSLAGILVTVPQWLLHGRQAPEPQHLDPRA